MIQIKNNIIIVENGKVNFSEIKVPIMLYQNLEAFYKNNVLLS